ncbi:MAG: DUF2442 domain-containing protein [Chloroflexota bacterium]
MALDQVTELATGVRFGDARLYVQLGSGSEVSVPLADFPRLLHATDAQRADYVLEEHGTAIHWPQVDEDIGLAHLLGLPEEALEKLVGLTRP